MYACMRSKLWNRYISSFVSSWKTLLLYLLPEEKVKSEKIVRLGFTGFLTVYLKVIVDAYPPEDHTAKSNFGRRSAINQVKVRKSGTRRVLAMVSEKPVSEGRACSLGT